jgi:DNA processing protein
MHTALSRRGTPGGGVGPGCRARPGTEVSGATLRASAILLAALVRAVILIEALDHAEAAMHTAVVAADLNRPLLAPPAIEDIRADGSARLLAERRAVLCPDRVRALALL